MAEDIVVQLEENLKEQPAHCLRPHQRLELEEEATRLNATLKLPDSISGAGKPHARIRYNQVIKMLAEQSPRSIDEPVRRDKVNKQQAELLENVIKPSMLTRTEMRRNPAGAVGEFMRRENAPYVQRAIRAWKRAQYALDPTTTDDDTALIEKHRREGTPWDGAASFMANAQIPGQFAMTPAAKANWPLIPPENTALEQAKRAERGPNGRKGVPVTSPKQLAALAAIRAAKTAKLEAARLEKAQAATQPSEPVTE